jgi:cyanobactin maturation PatA/PatG family protease
VYAIGELGYEFETEARRDSFLQEMGNGGNPHDGSQMLAHLKKNPHAAADIVWTLQLDDTPVYAIQPAGPFAATVYERLRAFLNDVLKDGVERVSIPGVINGKTSLMTGQVVPNLNPTLRGMFSWATGSLVETVVSKSSPKGPDPEVQRDRIRNFLDRIYYELRNLGVTSEQRAVNFMATNAFQVGEVMSRAVSDQLELDSITTERSPVCRPGSDCWDVKLAFFNPRNRMEEARRIFRLTVDVSDVLPVSVGRMRAWAAY